jgi:hypothetical protein
MKPYVDITQKRKILKNSSHIKIKSEPVLCIVFLRAGIEMKILSLAENTDRAEVTCHEDGDKME